MPKKIYDIKPPKVAHKTAKDVKEFLADYKKNNFGKGKGKGQPKGQPNKKQKFQGTSQRAWAYLEEPTTPHLFTSTPYPKGKGTGKGKSKGGKGKGLGKGLGKGKPL